LLKAQKEDTLLTLRNCARGFPATLARALEIPRSTARHRIQALEEDGIVRDYIPVVRPETFGRPYLIQVEINPEDYKFSGELESTVDALKEHLQAGIGHAPLCFFYHTDPECDLLRINCVTMTLNINNLVDTLYNEQNIARENIGIIDLDLANGIPDFSKFSLRKGEEGNGP
jgi:DNA-binding Lrp family transcriptional regulator